MTNTLKDVLGLSVIIISYEWMHGHLAIWQIDHAWWVYVICFVGLDFAGYWTHRIEHVINVFWNRHIIHHSSEEFNLACALRQSISGIVRWFFFLMIPMALIGVPPQVVSVVAPLHLFAQFWYHTRLIDRMGILEKFIVTPSHHRVHHAINAPYLDKNFGQIFIFWDKWFGTFQEEMPSEPPVYGVKKAVQTWNPIKINFQHLWSLVLDAVRTQSWKDKLRIWWMPTGWRPLDVQERFPIEYTVHAEDQVKYRTSSHPLLLGFAWVQLLVALIGMMHLFGQIGDLSFRWALYYGATILVSIYAYTSAMDVSRESIWVESIKFLMLLWGSLQLSSWFGIPAEYVLSYGFASLLYTAWVVPFIRRREDKGPMQTLSVES